MAVELKIPDVGESVTEAVIERWLKSEGDRVEKDEPVAELETDKVSVELPAPVAGTLSKILKQEGENAKVGEVIGEIEESAADEDDGGAAAEEEDDGSEGAEAREATETEGERKGEGDGEDDRGEPADEGAAEEAVDQEGEEESSEEGEDERRDAEGGSLRVMPAARRALEEHGLEAEEVSASGPGGRLLKEDVLRHVEERERKEKPEGEGDEEREVEGRGEETGRLTDRAEEEVPMSPIRKTTARRLVEAQRQGALLTTFNEVDMTEVQTLRSSHREPFQERYGIRLGIMSFFVKACVDALKRIPELNAEIRDDKIIYHRYHDIAIAVSTDRGLVTPVIRNAERLSFAQVEEAIADFSSRAQKGKIKLDELQGGTFTISNGGIFGSLMSTPIINPPQSGVLGMHAIQERPVAREGRVEIRPMMYLALTYDHRLIDGKEAVTFLRRIKETVEQPARMLLEI